MYFEPVDWATSKLSISNSPWIRDAPHSGPLAGCLLYPGAGGLIVTGSFTAVAQCDFITALAARHRLPSVYYDRFVAMGGHGLSVASSTQATVITKAIARC